MDSSTESMFVLNNLNLNILEYFSSEGAYTPEEIAKCLNLGERFAEWLANEPVDDQDPLLVLQYVGGVNDIALGEIEAALVCLIFPK